tara:strand:+ start:1466 stop:2287 length:822 start_codon:yes stop_codon:yes gene_type:complete
MKICIAGKNSIAINAVKHIIDCKIVSKDNILILNNPEDKGLDGWQPSFLKFAKDNNLSIVEIEALYKIDDLIFVSLEYSQIIKPHLFHLEALLLNIHFSLLPSYKGMYTSAHPILNGEKYSGVTLHKIDEGIDTGDIINQIRFDIDISDTARDLYLKYLKYSFQLFKKNIDNVINKNFNSTPQNSITSTYYSKKSIDYNNLTIDFKKTSFEIHNQLRAYIFEEYQLPIIDNKKIKKSVLLSKKIERNILLEQEEYFIISGIDNYKILAYKDEN